MNEYLEEYLAFLRSIVNDGKPEKILSVYL